MNIIDYIACISLQKGKSHTSTICWEKIIIISLLRWCVPFAGLNKKYTTVYDRTFGLWIPLKMTLHVFIATFRCQIVLFARLSFIQPMARAHSIVINELVFNLLLKSYETEDCNIPYTVLLEYIADPRQISCLKN